MPELSLLSWLLAFATIFVASFVQSSIGFGLAIVSAPILFLISPDFVPLPIMMATIVNTLHISIGLRQHWSLTKLWPALVARIPGGLIGAWLLVVVNTEFLALLIAAIISLGLVANVLRINLPVNKWTLSVAGFITGIAGTATSIGGPPMAILLQGQAPQLIRSQLATFFMFGALMSVVLLLPTEYASLPHWLLGAMLIPGVVLGGWAGERWGARISEQKLRVGTIVLCVTAVTGMLWRYFWP